MFSSKANNTGITCPAMRFVVRVWCAGVSGHAGPEVMGMR